MFHEGQQLGEYTLIGKLGRGGFGEVWLAENEDGLFAAKLPHKDQVDWKQITQEIGLWTLCGKHQNVMPLVGARNFNGQIAIISEYAPDGSLEDLLREKGKLSELEAVEMTIGILEGLQHLHESGIIHRDLKTDNILLNGKTPRLMDFGISRIITADSNSQTVIGTTYWMAPEAFDGKRNIQTDIWSVGVILYRMLGGNLPFPQKEQTARIAAIIMREPEPLPDSIPPALRNVVLKALAKNTTIRFRTSPQMRDELWSFLQTYTLEQKNDSDENTSTISETITREQIRLIPYRKGDKWGFCDANKNILIEPKYDDASRFNEGFSAVSLNRKESFVDKAGNEVIPFKYDYVGSFNEGLAYVSLNGKRGFIDKTGKEITPIKYDDADSFNEGVASVKLNGKYGFVDKTGKEITPIKYDLVCSFDKGLALVELNRKYGFIDKTGNEIVSIKYDLARPFNKDLATVELNNKWGLINQEGKEITPIEYDFLYSSTEGLFCAKLNGKWGLINNTGKEITPIKYDNADYFNEGMAMVQLNYKWGCIDKEGKEIIPIKYDEVFLFDEGLAIVGLNDQYGIISRTGKEVVSFNKYEAIYYGGKNFFRVELNGKTGFINKIGKEIVPIKYDSALEFEEGLVRVRLNGNSKSVADNSDFGAVLEAFEENEKAARYGFVDENGKEITPIKYDGADSFKDGLANVSLNHRWGYIGRDGTEYFED